MLQAGSPLGPVCSVQASAFRKSASCPCIVCVLACYRVVLVCLYWGGLGYGQCMLRTLPGCCINMLDSLARALFVQASTRASLFRSPARPAKVMATGPGAAQWMCPSAELGTSAPCRSC